MDVPNKGKVQVVDNVYTEYRRPPKQRLTKRKKNPQCLFFVLTAQAHEMMSPDLAAGEVHAAE